MSDKVELQAINKKDWIEIFPYGVTMGLDSTRPILIFKDKSENHVLPVALSPQDAGLAITENSLHVKGNSPHEVSFEMMKSLNIKLDRCLFTSIKGHHQFVELFFEGSKKFNKLNLRADSVMSFCLHANAKFYCSLNYIKESRQLDAEMSGSPKNVIMNDNGVRPEGIYLN